jgi:hypothetical protein
MMKSETEEENEIWLFSSELPLIETRKHLRERERGNNVFENEIEMK